jgi:hypothetical protein
MCEPQEPGGTKPSYQMELAGAGDESHTTELTFAGLARRRGGRDVHGRLASDHDVFLRHRDGDGLDFINAHVSVRLELKVA